MTAEVFLDTNVLVYAASRLAADAPKQKVALQLLTEASSGTSAQVLQEFYSVITRKVASPLSHGDAMDWLHNFEDVPFVSTDLALIAEGAEIANHYRLSYWDGAVIAAAERLGAKTLYTEDLNHGQKYGSVTAINPFKDIAG